MLTILFLLFGNIHDEVITKMKNDLPYFVMIFKSLLTTCLLYTSDAADDMQCVDLGGRRIIKK